ncbi:hypothetical protein D3C85_832500 [compost metagenome]
MQGKFHGSTAPTTPTGSRLIMPMLLGLDGDRVSYSLSPASACQRMVLAVSGMSMPKHSPTGLPASSDSSTASSRRLASIRSAKRIITALRSAGANLDQTPASKAARAACTAASMSSASQAATSVSTWPVAGLRVLKVVPELAATKRPSMKAWLRYSRRSSCWSMALRVRVSVMGFS